MKGQFQKLFVTLVNFESFTGCHSRLEEQEQHGLENSSNLEYVALCHILALDMLASTFCSPMTSAAGELYAS